MIGFIQAKQAVQIHRIKNVANRDKNHHMNETQGPAKLDK